MRLIHTSWDEKMNIITARPGLLGGAVICFSVWTDASTDEEIRRKAYVTGFTSGEGVHVHELECSGEFISADHLSPDSQAEAQIIDYFSRNMAYDGSNILDEYTPEDILDRTAERAVDEVDGGGWFIQGVRAQVARRAGYLGVIDKDEQGKVVIIDFENTDLNSGWQYLGKHGDWSDDLFNEDDED